MRTMFWTYTAIIAIGLGLYIAIGLLGRLLSWLGQSITGRAYFHNPETGIDHRRSPKGIVSAPVPTTAPDTNRSPSLSRR